MTQVSERLASLSPSETLAMSQKSSELKAKGIDVINLSVGETDFFTPDHIKEAARKAIEDNFSFYSPVPGYIDLRQAIAGKLKRENGLDYPVDHIVVSAGAKQAVCNVLLSIINPGDEVIIPAPYWVSYVEMVKLAQGKNVVIHASIEQDFKITASQLEEAITPRTKALILCSPNNPTGSVYSACELKALADVLVRHPEIVVLSDEIYEHINYCGRHESLSQFSEIRDRVVIINGVSKAYAMTGWRIGFLAAPLWIAKACNKLQGQYTSSASSIAQKAAIAAFSGDQSCVKKMRDSFLYRRNLILDLCRSIPDIRTSTPQGTFYIFPDMSAYIGHKTIEGQTIHDAAALSMYILETGHVATVGGDAFGAPGHLRLSYAVSDEQLRQAVQRMKNALTALK
ncbi:MAG: pyridoxal phosphate-dependent aminotransferase [Tannerellaceae bacterium]|jgi:aspartate aminotransferase|nr:pyridoxal phosphate-dependent aminotransferase [Tannerellaceae bacterium]